MKTRFFVIVLMVAVVGFGSCGKKKEQSSVNTIKSFTVQGVAYDVGASDITHIYAKVPTGGSWTGLPPTAVTPDIVLDDKNATITDENMELDFTKLGAGEGETTMRSYTVKAENGDTKTYSVKVTKGSLPQ